MAHVPHRGTAPALVDLIGGQVDVFLANTSSSLQFERTSKVLAAAVEQFSKALPGVPTFAEQKLPAMNAVTWFAVVEFAFLAARRLYLI